MSWVGLSADTPPQVADVITWAFERSRHHLIHGRKLAQINAAVESLTHVIWSSIYSSVEGRSVGRAG
jgi:hypothetical protein